MTEQKGPSTEHKLIKSMASGEVLSGVLGPAERSALRAVLQDIESLRAELEEQKNRSWKCYTCGDGLKPLKTVKELEDLRAEVADLKSEIKMLKQYKWKYEELREKKLSPKRCGECGSSQVRHIEDSKEKHWYQCEKCHQEFFLDIDYTSVVYGNLKRLKEQNAELEQCLAIAEAWAKDANDVIAHGAELMPLEQLSKWTGVRAVIETYPEDEIKKLRGG